MQVGVGNKNIYIISTPTGNACATTTTIL